jgi:hypothetical protein
VAATPALGATKPKPSNGKTRTVALDLSSPLKVVSWASAHADCPMRYQLSGTGELVIIFGRGPNEFELALDRGALRTLARLTAEALTKLDASVAEPSADLMTAGDRPA